jgi:GGDEF domain-containing protein
VAANSDGVHPRLSVSVGVDTYPQDGDTIEALLQHADRGLYRMKGHQKNFFSATTS